MTPFEAVFGRAPPSLLDYLADSTEVAAVDEVLNNRSNILRTLKTNLELAQTRMKNQADRKRIDVSFKVDDWVLLKLQPFKQLSLHRQASHKLSKRFFGPFRISQRIGLVAYRLVLPATSQLHDVFHVSKLKKFIGDPNLQHLPLPEDNQDQHPIFHPIAILKSRTILHHGQTERQHLVQWEQQSAADATWVREQALLSEFPGFHFEDKAGFEGGADVTKAQTIRADKAKGQDVEMHGSNSKVHNLRANPQSTRVTKLKDYVV